MIPDQRERAIREYVEKSMLPPNNCPSTMRLSGGLYGDGPTLGDIRDLLTSLEELRADNARLLVADGKRGFCGHCGSFWNQTMEPMKHRAWCVTLQEHPGSHLYEQLRTLQADLARTREALRKLAIYQDEPSRFGGCHVCDVGCAYGAEPPHKLVTIDGVEGMCPAKPEEE